MASPSPPTFSAMAAVAGGDSPRRSGDSCASASASSPEFEFWKLRNFSFSEHRLSPADELFVDGVLLPFKPPPPTPDAPQKPDPEAEAEPSASKRWKDIFRLGGEEKMEKEKKKQYKERRGGGGPGLGAADLNINIWPFSRSRSAGTSGPPRPKGAAAASPRKASSALLPQQLRRRVQVYHPPAHPAQPRPRRPCWPDQPRLARPPPRRQDQGPGPRPRRRRHRRFGLRHRPRRRRPCQSSEPQRSAVHGVPAEDELPEPQ